MASSYAFWVVLLFALLFSANHNEVVEADAVDPLLPICQTVGGRSHVAVDFCIAALGADKRSHDVVASYRNLSAIAVDLLTDNVTATASKIDDLLRKGGIAGGGVVATRILLSCQSLYTDIVGRQDACAESVKGGSFRLAQRYLWLTANAVKQCEGGFRDSHVASPVKVEDENAFKLARLAIGLLDHATT